MTTGSYTGDNTPKSGADERIPAHPIRIGPCRLRVFRALQKTSRCACYISTDPPQHRRTRVTADDCAAPAIGGSEDGRASLYGNGLVRLRLDGSVADGPAGPNHTFGRASACREAPARPGAPAKPPATAGQAHAEGRPSAARRRRRRPPRRPSRRPPRRPRQGREEGREEGRQEERKKSVKRVVRRAKRGAKRAVRRAKRAAKRGARKAVRRAKKATRGAKRAARRRRR